MKQMTKKLMAALLTVSMAAGLMIGCGSKSAGSDAAGGAAAQSGSGSPTLDKILADGKIVIGCSLNGAPLGFTDDSGTPMGYDVDWANRLGEVLGVEVEIQNVDAETRLPALTSGRVDVLFANTTGNLERAQTVDFTMPYLRCGVKMITAAGSNLHTIEDLNDPSINVSVNRGSTGEALVTQYAPNANILYVDNFTDSVLQLEQGKADASFEDNTVVDYAASQNDKLEAQEGLYTSDPICVVCRKGDMEFVRYLDMFVSWQISSGWQAETYEKWWGTEPAELDYIW